MRPVDSFITVRTILNMIALSMMTFSGFLLGCNGTPSPTVRERVHTILDKVTNETRWESENALCSIGPEAIDPLLDEVAGLHPTQDTLKSSVIIDALKRLGEPDRVRAALFKMSKSANPATRSNAVDALGFYLDRSELVDALSPYLADKDPLVQLALLSLEIDATDTRFRAFAKRFLNSENPAQRMSAARMLAKIGEPEAFAVIRALLDDKNDQIVVFAMWSLVEFGWKDVVDDFTALRSRAPRHLHPLIDEYIERAKNRTQ